MALAAFDRFIPMADLLSDERVDIETFRYVQNDIEPTGLGNLNDPLAVIDQTVVLCVKPCRFLAAQLTLYCEHAPANDTLRGVEAKCLCDPFEGKSRHHFY